MWAKLMGAAAILAGAWLFAAGLSSGLKKRRDSLGAFCRALVMLEGEISYCANCIQKALENISESVSLPGFFERVCADIPKRGIRRAWCDALAECRVPLGLTEEDVKILAALAAELGISDRENQIKNIRYVLSRLEPERAAAEERFRTLSRLYRSLCMFSGLAAVILLV